MNKIVLAALIVLFVSCSTTIKKYRKKDSVISKAKMLKVVVEVGGAAVTSTGASLGSFGGNVSTYGNSTSVSGSASAIGVGHSMSGKSQVLIAAKDLETELRMQGFNVVNDIKQAELVVLFSIGTVRYDPLAGWIADRSSVEFRDVKTNETLMILRSVDQLITATVNTHISNLVRDNV